MSGVTNGASPHQEMVMSDQTLLTWLLSLECTTTCCRLLSLVSSDEVWCISSKLTCALLREDGWCTISEISYYGKWRWYDVPWDTTFSTCVEQMVLIFIGHIYSFDHHWLFRGGPPVISFIKVQLKVASSWDHNWLLCSGTLEALCVRQGHLLKEASCAS